MEDIVWAKGGVRPGTKSIEVADETNRDSKVFVYTENIDWVKIPDHKNMGKWAGSNARVLDTHQYPCPLDRTHICKWHRLDGPFWCAECAECSQWAILEKGEADQWLNQSK